MKRFLSFVVAVVVLLATACSEYKYDTVKGDPLKTRIYTLDNGLKVYMTVNDEQPRIQTYIAVKVGAKNDPMETTGLAHYFEHLMFKGSEKFGTQDYAAEKPLLDEIEALFELYRTKSNEAERKAIYAKIDSVSQLASQYAIPNEYDKLMSAIGASGTNAWTSMDETVYTEDIPSNQVENWAKVQSDRFANNVIRGFHTELETVYEEYNMSLTRDGNKAYYGLMELLFPNHPYGQHTVLGFQDHLKNPSITNIKNYYRTYYVPNNMAICLSGDLNPDKTIEIIDRYFGSMQPNESLPKFTTPDEEPITAPKSKEVVGPEAEFVYVGWRTEGSAASDDALMASLVSAILSNGKCGLIDVNLEQQQRVLGAGAFDLMMADRGSVVVAGYSKQGQTLDEVKELLLNEVGKLRNGEFDEALLASTIANYKLDLMRQMESNDARAMAYVESFINGSDWADEVTALDRMSRITKQEIVAWAEKYLREDNYVALYKRQGEDKSQKKIDKPSITPIAANRDAVSDFLAEIQQSEVEPIDPVFVDYERDLTRSEMKQGVEVLYKQNMLNDIFSLTYLYRIGNDNDPSMQLAEAYFDLLGTDSQSLEEIQRAYYDMACNFSLSVRNNRTYITITGLSEYMDDAIRLTEEYLGNVQGNEETLAELKRDEMKSRSDAKLSQQSSFSALRNYVVYGGDVIKKRTLTNEQLMALTSEQLLSSIRSLNDYEHTVIYYGPLKAKEVVERLNNLRNIADDLKPLEPIHNDIMATPSNQVILAQYDAKQIYYLQYTNLDRRFDIDNVAAITLYNNYFSGGMNSIVFQEMREARALAYSSYATLSNSHKEDNYYYYAFIATQNDKMRTAIEAFEQIINDMPLSETAFEIAKQSIITSLQTERITGDNIAWNYLNNREMGIDIDPRKIVYEKIQSMTLDDVSALQQEWIKNRNYTYCVLGDLNDIDMNYLKSLGKVTIVKQSDYFGY